MASTAPLTTEESKPKRKPPTAPATASQMTRFGIFAAVWSWVVVIWLPRQIVVSGLRRNYPVLHRSLHGAHHGDRESEPKHSGTGRLNAPAGAAEAAPAGGCDPALRSVRRGRGAFPGGGLRVRELLVRQ